ncbi:MAG TPA: spore coat protein U domain-containing protein [Burkholderiales bacterium]
MTRTLRALSALALFGAAAAAQAAITCSVSVTAISVPYDPSVSGDTVRTGSYTISCTRLAADANTLGWSLGANDGQQPSGQTNRAMLNGAYYNYELYRLAPYTNVNRWRDQNASVRFSGTLNFGTSLTASQSGPFDLRLGGPQTVQPAGIYTDLVTATLRNSATSVVLAQAAFAISVITSPTCVLSTPPGNVSFAYRSFQGTAASASTSFGVRCTTGLSYSMTLDTSSASLLGLSYSLSLSQASGSGNGTTQTYSVNGSMPAGQAGTCATATCSASRVHTLMVTY